MPDDRRVREEEEGFRNEREEGRNGESGDGVQGETSGTSSATRRVHLTR